MANHRDEVGCNTLVVTIGASNKSTLVWKRGDEIHTVHYSGHTFSVVGGIHSKFFDFSTNGNHIFHRSVNLDKNFREIIVLRFKMHAELRLGINADTVVAFVNIIKSIEW